MSAPWKQELYDSLVFGLENTDRDSLASNFFPPEFGKHDLDGQTLGGLPAKQAIWMIEDYFLSYSHGDPNPEHWYDERRQFIDVVKRELESSLRSRD